eukprot:TRINITY_DN12608_c0_g1_i1.p1 TRINITY_DN12608_c0_g1~~TRINITY_DN12608_c0_g1_i1.p1  ORF type:complete len:240 (+),score=40.28 TRINITY_DN12608_c0_g1_i1:64-783(+)
MCIRDRTCYIYKSEDLSKQIANVLRIPNDQFIFYIHPCLSLDHEGVNYLEHKQYWLDKGNNIAEDISFLYFLIIRQKVDSKSISKIEELIANSFMDRITRLRRFIIFHCYHEKILKQENISHHDIQLFVSYSNYSSFKKMEPALFEKIRQLKIFDNSFIEFMLSNLKQHRIKTFTDKNPLEKTVGEMKTLFIYEPSATDFICIIDLQEGLIDDIYFIVKEDEDTSVACLLYTSPSPRDS